MKVKPVTYFLDGQAAIDAAMSQTAGEEIFYYDGPEITTAPKNCINVPIDRFYSHFQAGFTPLPVALDFSNKEFSEAVQTAITQSLEEAVVSLRQEILNSIDPAAVNQETVDGVLVNAMVLLFSVNDGLNEEDSALIEKLIELSLSVYEKDGFEIQDGTKGLLNEYLDNDSEEVLLNNIKALSVWYALSLILNTENKAGLDKIYFTLLAKSNDLMEIYHNYPLIAQAFPAKYFDSYVENYSKALLVDGFISKPIREQKEAVCKLVYFTIMFYERNKSFLKIYEALYGVYREAVASGSAELILWLYSPLLYCHNSVLIAQEDFARFNENIDKPLSNYIKDTLSSELNLKPCQNGLAVNSPVVKVGFLVERVLDYSLTNVLCALLNNLAAENLANYQFVIYDLNFRELGGSNAEAVAKLYATGFEYIDLHREIVGSHEHFYSILDKVIKVREKIIRDGIHVLIATNGRPEVNFLFSTRTAPVQVFWTHGNYVFDCDGIDKRIVHYVSDDYKHYGHEFSAFEIAPDYRSSNPEANQAQAMSLREKWPPNTIVLGSIGRLSKIDNAGYLDIVAKLLTVNADTVYVACGSGDQSELQAKIAKLGISDRFYFEGFVDPEIYAFVIDVYLDPFPNGGGESLQEYRARTEQGRVVCVNEEPVRFFSNGMDTYLLKASTYIQYFRKLATNINCAENDFTDAQVIICSDPPVDQSHSELIAYLLEKHDNVFYAVPQDDSPYSELISSIPGHKLLKPGTGNLFDYAELADLYLVFYNYALRDIYLDPQNIFYIQTISGSFGDSSIGDYWISVQANSLFARVVNQLLDATSTLFDTAERKIEAFHLYHKLAGLDSEQIEMLYHCPLSGMERTKTFCELVLSNQGFAKLTQQFSALYYRYSLEAQSTVTKPVLKSFFDALCWR